MKKQLLVQFGKTCLIAMFGMAVFVSDATAQKKYSEGNAPFSKGTNVFGLFAGVGDGYPSYTPASVFFGATFDHGIINNAGPGNIGIGGLVGFRTSSANHYGFGDNSYNSFIVAARGTYHLTLLVDKNNQFDPYAGINIGASFNNRKHKYAYETDFDDVSPIGGAFIGAGYKFAPNVGVFAEAGAGTLSYARGGINFYF